MSHVAFEKLQSGFVIKAITDATQDATIEISMDGELVRSFKYPAYRIWNVEAHSQEVIEELLAELAEGHIVEGKIE